MHLQKVVGLAAMHDVATTAQTKEAALPFVIREGGRRMCSTQLASAECKSCLRIGKTYSLLVCE